MKPVTFFLFALLLGIPCKTIPNTYPAIISETESYLVNVRTDTGNIPKNNVSAIIENTPPNQSQPDQSPGYPVKPFSDTLFLIYNKIGASTARERAINISGRIRQLYEDDFLKIDSVITVPSDNTIDIVYREMIIMSISDHDAFRNNKSKLSLANEYLSIIKKSIINEKEQESLIKLILRISLAIIVIAGILLLIWLMGKLHIRIADYISLRKDALFKGLSYKDYTFLSVQQELNLAFFILRILKWFFIVLSLYLVLPIIFSIFPFSRGWAKALFDLVWSPLKGVLVSVWHYLPNLFSIMVIYFVMKYSIRFVKYIFSEIEAGKLKISGFHAEWADPTFQIVRFILYAFMFVLIFPYLPGSDSGIFKGVSVFLGVLLSLGSSSAISNMISGLVITYMRPFKIGDRIKIGEVTGDIIEKNLLVTRIRTIKNELITIPNSAVLSANTVNYSSYSNDKGLIIYTSVSIGYDVSWKDVQKALIEAAMRTDLILADPTPFVLQTSLEDFYIVYQCNAYIREANQQSLIYSNLHQNILDVCNERGIEILSPHYRAQRDGNATAIPSDYIPKEYEPDSFKITATVKEKKNH